MTLNDLLVLGLIALGLVALVRNGQISKRFLVLWLVCSVVIGFVMFKNVNGIPPLVGQPWHVKLILIPFGAVGLGVMAAWAVRIVLWVLGVWLTLPGPDAPPNQRWPFGG